MYVCGQSEIFCTDAGHFDCLVVFVMNVILYNRDIMTVCYMNSYLFLVNYNVP